MTQVNTNKLFTVFVLITALSLLQNRINTKRYHRGRQALLPPIALFYAVVATVAVSALYSRIRQLLIRWMNGLLGSLLLRALPALRARLLNMPAFLGYSEILIFNVLLIFAFLAVKSAVCPILASKWKDNRLMEATSVRYYEYDEVFHEWFLRKRWVNFRRIVRVYAICADLLTVCILYMTWNTRSNNATWLVCFPGAMLLVVNEVWGFINGYTREEYLHNVIGTESDARRTGSYYRIREIYEKLFAPQLLASHTGTEFTARQGVEQLLVTLEESEDKVDRVAAQYFRTYSDRMLFDADCVQASNKLMHGSSVVFFNPFYRDLGPYLTLPMVNALLRGKKLLVIGSRNSICKDIDPWLTELFRRYSHIRSMWRVKELSASKPDCEIGVLRFQQLYDVEVLAANRDFFCEVDFVLLLEPSMMVNTGQVGLTIVSEEISRYAEKPTYCVCDRYADGLVDTMSHLLKTEITDVVAPPVPRCIYTGMAWNADGDYIRQRLFDKQTRFLGNGIELAAVAVKNQIPQVVWYGETKVPLRDIKWIAGQHHPTICRYMNVPTQQKSLYEKIRFVPNLWCTPSSKEQFIITEDEFCNMFSLMRAFLSHGTDQTFVNVLSENYLLRDYMRCNQQMFLSNPNAIPSFIPDYAKTERNTVLKLVVLMAVRPVEESEIVNELRLAGCTVGDAFDTLSQLLKKYTFADGSVLEIRTVTEDVNLPMAHNCVYYSISSSAFKEHFASSLSNACYIVEDEKWDTEFIDAKMFGHITQTILPGQFVTYDGKYYEVRRVSPVNGIVLRRASDLYSGRRYYRQMRTYRFEPLKEDSLISARTVMDMELCILRCSFSVETAGYLEMGDNHDLRMARVVNFEGDPEARSYDRRYRSKNVLRIRLPDTDDKIRFTVSMLLSEVFRSVFPDAWQYLAVFARRPDDIDGMLNHIVYTVEGDIDDECIYVVEDSDLDLGLLDAVSRALPQLLEIVADFIDWHFEKMREPEHEDPEPVEVRPQEREKRGLFLRMADRIRKLFGGRKQERPRVVALDIPKEKPSSEEEIAEEDAQDTTAFTEYSLDEEPAVPETGWGKDEEEAEEQERPAAPPVEDYPEDTASWVKDDDAEIFHVDGTDIFESEGEPEDTEWLEESFAAAGITPIGKTRYQRECYLKFGFEEIDGRLRIEDVQKYLHVRGWCNNSLTKARKRDRIDMQELDLEVTNRCDFCGAPLSGVSNEVLTDGRVRCNDCSTSAIRTVDELRDIFYRALEMMQMFYGVSYSAPITVEMADAKVIAKGAHQVFKPSTDYAARVLGFAQMRRGTYRILIENGSPRLVTIDTMVHEMTHIWQYLNWKRRMVEDTYAMNDKGCTKLAVNIVYEGMAVWSSIQYLYQIGETYFAAQQEAFERSREDIYGIGFRLYCEQYPLVKDLSLLKFTPFVSFPPIDPDEVRNAVKEHCTKDQCVC